MAYDSNNIFAKILRGEIPCKKVYEDDFALAFHDINPQAPTHILVVPKGPYVNYDDFVTSAETEELAGFARAIGKTIAEAGVAQGGYRLISNSGVDAHQEVPHYHIHILGGRDLGAMLEKAEA
ncbi:MAG: histidine triad nucleotide-binding protein [Alphaproteobacteria bacterium]|nr:histidine triad nucleotide-binding protein [Alphaproteobacteria bacterium]